MSRYNKGGKYTCCDTTPCNPCCEVSLMTDCIYLSKALTDFLGADKFTSLTDLLLNVDRSFKTIDDKLDELEEMIPDGSGSDNLFTRSLVLTENRVHNGGNNLFDMNDFGRFSVTAVPLTGSSFDFTSTLRLVTQGFLLQNKNSDNTIQSNVNGSIFGLTLSYDDNGSGGSINILNSGLNITTTDLFINIPTNTEGNGALLTLANNGTGQSEWSKDIEVDTLKINNPVSTNGMLNKTILIRDTVLNTVDEISLADFMTALGL